MTGVTQSITEDSLFGKIVTAAIIGLLGWLIVTVQNVSVQQATATTEIVNLKELVVTMQSNFYSKDEAETRLSNIETEIFRLRDRVYNLERENRAEESQE